MKIFTAIHLIATLAMVGLLWGTYSFLMSQQPPLEKYTQTRNEVGIYRWTSNYRMSTASLNDRTIFLEVGAFGGNNGPDARNIPSGTKINATIVDIKTLKGSKPFLIAAKTNNIVYFSRTPEESLIRWKEDTVSDFIGIAIIIIVLYVQVLVFL